RRSSGTAGKTSPSFLSLLSLESLPSLVFARILSGAALRGERLFAHDQIGIPGQQPFARGGLPEHREHVAGTLGPGSSFRRGHHDLDVGPRVGEVSRGVEVLDLLHALDPKFAGE